MKVPSLRENAIAAALVLCAGFALVFFYAPLDADQGFIQKIFYLHVPLAMCSLGGFVIGGARATSPLLDAAGAGSIEGRWLLILALYDLVFGLLAYAIFDFLLED